MKKQVTWAKANRTEQRKSELEFKSGWSAKYKIQKTSEASADKRRNKLRDDEQL